MSVTVFVPVELDGPALLMVILYWPEPPLVNAPIAVLVMVRSKLELSGVTGVVIGPLSLVQVGHSFGLLTVAELPGNGLGAVGLIVTSKISKLLAPAAMTFGFVQVMLGIVPVQVHAAVEPALTVYAVTPVGNTSPTVVVPVEFDGPPLVTVILYCPEPPDVNCPTVVLTMCRSKLLVTGVVPLEAELLPGVESPGLLTAALFAGSGLGAAGESVTSRTMIVEPLGGIDVVLVQLTFGTLPVQFQPALVAPFIV